MEKILARAAIAAVILLICVVPLYTIPQPVHMDVTAQAASNPSPGNGVFVEFFLQAIQLSAKVPSGTTLKQADFKATLGDQTANALIGAGVTQISNNGGHFQLVFSAGGFEGDINNVHYRFEPLVECDARTTQSGTKLTNVKGVDVYSAVLYLVPSFGTVQQMTLTKDAASGDVTVTAHVLWNGVVPADYSVTTRPDGTPITN